MPFLTRLGHRYRNAAIARAPCARSSDTRFTFVMTSLVNTNGIRISTLALGARLPTVYNLRESVEAGGLMSYGATVPDLFRRAADYVDKILRGTKPSDLPIEQPTKFELVFNLKTAKALGLTVWARRSALRCITAGKFLAVRSLKKTTVKRLRLAVSREIRLWASISQH